MKRSNKLIIIGAFLVVAVILLIAVILSGGKEEKSEAYKVVESEKVSVRIKAVGDNLIHSPIYNSCRTEDGFDFDGLYENIAVHIEDADIAAINQETIFVESVSALSGYPSFGTPHQVGESVIKAGFNLVTHATNHTYDKGYDALIHTMDFWDENKVKVLGINRSEKEQHVLDIWEKDGLKVAMLNFTYGLNGYRLPQDKPYLVNLLDYEEINERLLKKAEESADITVVFVHFGTEYTHTPTEEQKKHVEFMCENGADIIIGTHPHVIQPVTEHISENGNRALVYYSLGNFLSNQSGIEKILGAMADVTIVKEDGHTYVESYDVYPTVTHADNNGYGAYMLDEYTDELARVHKRCYGLTKEKLHTLFDRVMAIEVK